MSDFPLLAGFYFTQLKNKLLNPNRRSLLKGFFMLVFASIFFPMVFTLFSFIFRHFAKVPIIGNLLIYKILSTLFLTLSVLVVLSSIITAIPVLFLSRDMDFLFSSPVRIRSIFTTQFVKIITGASWMILLMSIPILGAYARVVKIDIYEYLFILLSHIPFFVILSSAGIVLTLLLIKFFPAENIRNIAVAISGIFLAVLVIYFRMLEPEKITGAGLEQVSEFIKNIRTPESVFLPHYYFMKIIKSTAGYGIFAGLGHLVLYLCLSVVVFGAVVLISEKLYFEGYAKKGVYKKAKKLKKDYEPSSRPFFLSQLIKDFKYLVRDTSQWIQVVFLFGIIAIYLFNIYKLPADLFDLRNVVYFLNIIFIGFILSAIGARFILPVISTEGKGFWIFRAAPISMKKYLIYKLLVYGVPVIITGQAVAFITINILKSDAFINFITYYTTFCVTLVISATGIGFGALFADFNIRNPEDIITGFSGLIYMLVTVLYVGLVFMLESGVVKDYYYSKVIKAKEFALSEHMTSLVLVALIGLAIGIISVIIGLRRLEAMET